MIAFARKRHTAPMTPPHQPSASAQSTCSSAARVNFRVNFRARLRWRIDIARDDPVNPAISSRGLYIGRHGPWELENAHQRVTGQLVPNPLQDNWFRL